MGAIFTIGYGGRKFSNFLFLLKVHNITLVVDIRRIPRSSVTEYGKESLEQLLPEVGITYVFMGETFGGFRRGGYTRHMQTEAYQEGIKRLLKLAEKENLVLMCKERNDAGCHRRYIVSTLNNVNESVTPI